MVMGSPYIIWDFDITRQMCVYYKVHFCVAFRDYRRDVMYEFITLVPIYHGHKLRAQTQVNDQLCRLIDQLQKAINVCSLVLITVIEKSTLSKAHLLHSTRPQKNTGHYPYYY